MSDISAVLGTRGLLPGDPDAIACSTIVGISAAHCSRSMPNACGLGTARSRLSPSSSVTSRQQLSYSRRMQYDKTICHIANIYRQCSYQSNHCESLT